MSPVLSDETIDSMPEVGPIAFAVWCRLLVHRNRQTGKCCPSVSTIATKTGLDKKTVLRGIAKLEQAGWITVVRDQTPGGRPIANQYVPAPRLLVAQRDQRDGSVGGGEGPTLVAERDQLVAERDQALVAERDQNPKKDRTPRSEPHSSSKKLRFSDNDAATAKWMFGLLRKMNPKHKEPNFAKWAEAIRLTRERDGVTDEEIRSLFSWANAHDFWCKNILCPEKLREKWDRLTIERNSQNGNGNGRPSQRNLITPGALFVES